MISAKRYIWDECSSSNDLSSRIDFPGEDRDGIDSGDQSFYSPGVSWRSGNAKTMMTQTELAIIDGEDDDEIGGLKFEGFSQEIFLRYCSLHQTPF